MVMLGSQVGYSATADAATLTVAREAKQIPGILDVDRGDRLWYVRYDGRIDRYLDMAWSALDTDIQLSLYFMEEPQDQAYPLPTEERFGTTYVNELVLQLEPNAIPEMVMARLERVLRPKLAKVKLPLESQWPGERGCNMNSLPLLLRLSLTKSSNLWRVQELIEASLVRYPQFRGMSEPCSHLVLGGMASCPSIGVDIETDSSGMWIRVTDGYLRHCFRSQLRVDLLEDSSKLMAQRLENWLHRNLDCSVRIW